MADMTQTWIKSSYSGSQGGNCVEAAADTRGGILVRDTKNREGAVLGFRAVAWRRFADEIKSGHARILAVPGFPELDRGRLSTRRRPLFVPARHSVSVSVSAAAPPAAPAPAPASPARPGVCPKAHSGTL
ncbi:MAG: DUF397 domain-containing protein [Trebonia sp.]